MRARLTKAKKEAIWRAIADNRQADDRDPEEVIRTRYGGSETKYLRDMAVWHKVPI